MLIESIFMLNWFNTLILILTGTFVIWYAQYHWRRRNLYRMAAQVNGPLALPIVGNALDLIGSNEDVLDSFMQVSKLHESPARLWFGQELYFGIWVPADMEIILNSPHALTKAGFHKFTAELCGNGLLTAPVPIWKRHRKLIAPTFNQKILEEYVETFAKQSDILVEKLKLEAGKEGTFDVFTLVSRCALDIVCETAMGVSVNAQQTESEFVHWFNRALETCVIRIFNIWYHPHFIFSRTTVGKDFYEAVKKLNEFTRAVVIKRRKAYEEKLKEATEKSETVFEDEPRKRSSFLQKMIELSHIGATLTDQELQDEVNILVEAGNDTSASTMSFAFMMLGIFPDVQQKLYEEVVDQLGPDRPVESTDLPKLQYLEMVIKETLRLFPSGPIIGREVTGDVKLERCALSAGCSVVLLIIGMHRDPKLWPNPLHFDPNRFLPEEVSKRHPYSWLPFSGGPRNCIGMKFAMMSMKTVIATVIRKYRFSTDYKSVEEIKLKIDFTLKAADGYRVSVERRE